MKLDDLTPKTKARVLFLLVMVLGVVLDQLTKFLAVRFLKDAPRVPILGEILTLDFTTNPGAAFGMLKEHRWVFLLISTVAIVAIGVYVWFHSEMPKLSLVSLGMIVSGGVGNMIDRVAAGEVVDFIHFEIPAIGFDFAIFNGADAFVSVGAALLVLSLLLDVIAEAKNAKNGEKHE